MILGRNNDFYMTGSTAEDQAKINVCRLEAQETLDKSMYLEAANRVVFRNCMGVCGLDIQTLPNFNKDFYYNRPQEQACLQDCYNSRMALHFGSTAKKEGKWLDFEAMKQEFRNYEMWNPNNRLAYAMTQSHTEQEVNDITKKLINKTKNAASKFEFN